MKDGGKKVIVLVSNPALEQIEIAPIDHDSYFGTFKVYRKSFERIASKKYDNGYVEIDGTVCIRAMDVPLASANWPQNLPPVRVMVLLAVALPSLLSAMSPPPMTTTVIVIPANMAMMMPPPPPSATIVMIIVVSGELHSPYRWNSLDAVSGQGDRSAGREPHGQGCADTGAKQLFHC